MLRTRYVAAASFFFTVAFFFEYTPLLRRVHIPFDLEGFHFPLADYAYQAIHQGRFPQWDPTIYSGLSFTGNIQAGLFYPPTWLMFAFNMGRSKLTYQGLEDLTLAHVWIAFLLCYIWLRHEKGLHTLACVLGASVFAFSGYMLMQLQHFGLVAGYAWMPLGFAGIDAADRLHRWRPLWKLAAASALCFLAGYPSTWVAFSICMFAYACARKRALRLAAQVTCALAGSLLLAAVQLLPALEASQAKVPEPKFGIASGTKDPRYFISYFLPNYFDFGLDVPVETNLGQDYLYLGAPAFAGLALILIRRSFGGAGPPLAVFVTSLLFVTNPFGALGNVIGRSTALAQVFSTYYFLAGVTAAVAVLAAIGLDYGLRGTRKAPPRWFAATTITLSLGWSIRLALVWIDGKKFATRWLSGVDALAASILFVLLIVVFTGSSGFFRGCAAAALLILTAAEYKAFGTSKRFDATRGRLDIEYVLQPSPGLNAGVYQSLLQHPEYRSALDLTAPFPTDLRHTGLTTPQGFDPFIPEQYRILIEGISHFRTNREFDLNPDDGEALRLLGVRYFISSENGPLCSRLSSSPHFRLLQPADSYYKVFEYADSRPSFGWEEMDHEVELRAWQPERRAFTVRSPSGGRFRLAEQFFPGWNATVDEIQVSIERCHNAFQCIAVPPGQHRVEFRYHSRWLILGGIVSLCSILLLAKCIKQPCAARCGSTPSPTRFGPGGLRRNSGHSSRTLETCQRNAPAEPLYPL